MRNSQVFLDPIKNIHDVIKFFEQLKKHSTKSVFLGSQDKGSKCEGKPGPHYYSLCKEIQ